MGIKRKLLAQKIIGWLPSVAGLDFETEVKRGNRYKKRDGVDPIPLFKSFRLTNAEAI